MAYRSAVELLADLDARRVSARELLELHSDRRDRLDPALNAVVNTDLERAGRDALRIDEARASGRPVGPLAGVPMTVKDGFDVAGMPSVCGVPAFLDRPKDCPDADVVASARAAGAVIWGKTNVPSMLSDFQTYNAVYGTTNNPHDPTRTPGGSSGGAAVALATGMTALEIGSDIGGSLRHPANFCGVYALKPTWNQLSMRGQVPPGPGTFLNMDLGVVGPMARSVADLRLLYRVLRGGPVPPEPAGGEFRVALWLDEPEFVLSDQVGGPLHRLADELAASGMAVRPVRPPIAMSSLLGSYFGLLFSTLMAGSPDGVYQRLLAQRGTAEAEVAAGASRYSMAAFVLSATASFRDVQRQRLVRQDIKNAMVDWFRDWDAILAPIGPTPAFTHLQNGVMAERRLPVDGGEQPYFRLLDWIALATATHAPAVAVPVGRTESGLPVGVQLIGRWGEEERLLELAARIERVTGGFCPPDAAK
ncbi:MAG TPA: amidase family protein [Pseudonocardia sp.]